MLMLCSPAGVGCAQRRRATQKLIETNACCLSTPTATYRHVWHGSQDAEPLRISREDGIRYCRNKGLKLSTFDETVLDIPDLDISIKFTRGHLDEIMGGMLRSIELIIDEVILGAGCRTSDIDIVIRTGGSSQIVAIRRLLENRFPNRVTEHDPFSSVAAGLAIASYHGYQSKV